MRNTQSGKNQVYSKWVKGFLATLEMERERRAKPRAGGI